MPFDIHTFVKINNTMAYTEEQKKNYVFLLHYRYKDNFQKCARGTHMNVGTIKDWSVLFLPFILEEMEDPANVNSERKVPTLRSLKEKALIRMEETLDKTMDFANVTRGLAVIEGLMGEKSDEKVDDLFEEINKSWKDKPRKTTKK